MRCICCGRFLSYEEMQDGTAHFYFEPDSHKGPEVSDWECAKCVAKWLPADSVSLQDSVARPDRIGK